MKFLKSLMISNYHLANANILLVSDSRWLLVSAKKKKKMMNEDGALGAIFPITSRSIM